MHGLESWSWSDLLSDEFNFILGLVSIFLFETLNKLADDKLIVQFKDKKLVILTDAGKQMAEKLKTKYLS